MDDFEYYGRLWAARDELIVRAEQIAGTRELGLDAHDAIERMSAASGADDSEDFWAAWDDLGRLLADDLEVNPPRS